MERDMVKIKKCLSDLNKDKFDHLRYSSRDEDSPTNIPRMNTCGQCYMVSLILHCTNKSSLLDINVCVVDLLGIEFGFQYNGRG